MKVSGTVNLVANFDWEILNLEEIRIDVNTEDEAGIINLPQITTNNGRNVKLFINHDVDFDSNNEITINAWQGDTIQGSVSVVIPAGQRGIWLFIQDDIVWSSVSAEFVPASLLGMDIVIRGNFNQGYEAVVSGGVEPYTYEWSLQTDTMEGFNIVDGVTDQELVELEFRANPPGDVQGKSQFQPDAASDINQINIGLLQIKVMDSFGTIANAYKLVMVPQFA
jgi:hypothetical protein